MVLSILSNKNNVYTVIWFQVFLSKSFSNRSILPIGGIQTDITTPVQSRPGSNSSDGVLHTTQSCRTEASPPDASLLS